MANSDPESMDDPLREDAPQGLGTQSKQTYTACYNRFTEWKKTKEISETNGKVVLAYFHEMAQALKPSSLWSIYSMLKYTLLTNENFDITKNEKITKFLKETSAGFKSKPTPVLTSTEVGKFLFEAPDDEYLAMKVALIFGITGTCKTDELVHLIVDDVEDDGTMLLVKIRPIWGGKPRTFSIVGEFYNIVKKYMDQRPERVTNKRFFLRYQNGKYVNLAIGKHKFGSMPRSIATYLNLPNPEEFTGHSIRRTSMALIAASSEDHVTLREYGEASTPSRACFMAHAINLKRNLSQQLTEKILSEPSPKQMRTDSPVPSTSGTNRRNSPRGNEDSKNQFLEVEVKTEFDDYLDDSIDALDLESDDNDVSSDSQLTAVGGGSLGNPIQTGCKELDSILNTDENNVTIDDDDDKNGILDSCENREERQQTKEKSNVSEINSIEKSKNLPKSTEEAFTRIADEISTLCKTIDANQRRMHEEMKKFFGKFLDDKDKRHQEYVDLQMEKLDVKKQELALRERELKLREKEATNGQS